MNHALQKQTWSLLCLTVACAEVFLSEILKFAVCMSGGDLASQSVCSLEPRPDSTLGGGSGYETRVCCLLAQWRRSRWGSRILSTVLLHCQTPHSSWEHWTQSPTAATNVTSPSQHITWQHSSILIECCSLKPINPGFGPGLHDLHEKMMTTTYSPPWQNVAASNPCRPSVLDFVSQFGEKSDFSPKLWDKIWNRKPDFNW